MFVIESRHLFKYLYLESTTNEKKKKKSVCACTYIFICNMKKYGAYLPYTSNAMTMERFSSES